MPAEFGISVLGKVESMSLLICVWYPVASVHTDFESSLENLAFLLDLEGSTLQSLVSHSVLT